MALLLDTHVVLGLVDEALYPLPVRFADRIKKDTQQFIVSCATLWEIALKHRIGKLPLSEPLSYWPEALAAADFRLIGITHEHVLADVYPLPVTKDPFDRVLLATAAVERLQLASIDRALLDHPLAWRP